MRRKMPKVKGKGGVVGLTENSAAFGRWVLTETARIIEEVEQVFLPEADLDINYRHHEEGASAEEKNCINKHQASLKPSTNIFMDDCKELLVLNTRDCVDGSIAKSVGEIEPVRKKKYHQLKERYLIYNVRAFIPQLGETS